MVRVIPLFPRGPCAVFSYSHLLRCSSATDVRKTQKLGKDHLSLYSLPSREGGRALCSLELSFTLSVFPPVLLWEAAEEPL